jgi:hypothetical protein
MGVEGGDNENGEQDDAAEHDGQEYGILTTK